MQNILLNLNQILPFYRMKYLYLDGASISFMQLSNTSETDSSLLRLFNDLFGRLS